MSWSYDLEIIETDEPTQVRFLCGDTDENDQLVQDEEIAFALAQEPNMLFAAALLCRGISAKFARRADSAVGELRESASQKSKAYMDQAIRIEQKAAVNAMPVFGGLSKSKKDLLRQDEDAVQPSFAIGQDDNPYAPNERQTPQWPSWWWR